MKPVASGVGGPEAPDGPVSGSDVGSWRLVGAVAQGASHMASGIACQDSIASWISADGTHLVAALADGAGSAPESETGAKTAVQSVADHFRNMIQVGPIGAEAMDWLFKNARDAVRVAAEGLRRPVAELACTLAVVLISKDTFCAAQVGDGLVVARWADDGAIRNVATAMRGEYANEVTFLTSGESLPAFDILEVPAVQIDAFCLSSDGLRLVITETGVLGEPFIPFYTDAFSAVGSGASEASIEAFLHEVDDRTGDDKSLLLGVRRTGVLP